jgi:hypothetical protein
MALQKKGGNTGGEKEKKELKQEFKKTSNELLAEVYRTPGTGASACPRHASTLAVSQS